MSHKLIKGYNKFIAFLLSILGLGSSATFTACDIVTGGCEYGTPHANFKISGTVTNESGETVNGVKVLMMYDSTYTDANGDYDIVAEDFPTDQTFPIQFIDIDGDDNGKLQTLDTTVVFVDPEFKNGDKHWYEGETLKTFDVTMKEEE